MHQTIFEQKTNAFMLFPSMICLFPFFLMTMHYFHAIKCWKTKKNDFKIKAFGDAYKILL